MSIPILNRVAATTTDEVVKLEVDITPTNGLHKILQNKGLLPLKRTFELTGVRMGTLIRISRILLSIDVNFFDKENLLQSNYEAIEKYGECLAKCVALCIHNKQSEAPQRLTNFILRNFTTAELLRVLGIVMKQMDVGSFMSTIISIKGMNILERRDASVSSAKEMSLQAGEIIAPGEQSEV